MNHFERPLDVHQKLVEFAGSGRAFALAVILKAEGHTPQKAGVKAIIDGDGRIWGTLGGGLGEAEAQRLGREACQTGRAIVFDFKMTDAYAREAGPICGGSMRILIDPNARQYRAAYAQAGEALAQRKRGVLVTRVYQQQDLTVEVRWVAQDDLSKANGIPGTKAVGACLADGKPRYFVTNTQAPGDAESQELILEASSEQHGRRDRPSGTLPDLEDAHPALQGGAESESSLRDCKVQSIHEQANIEVLVEPVIPPPMLLIAGGGHVGQALARLAAWNGFAVTVIDDRPEFTDPALFGTGVRTRCGEIAGEIARFPIDRDTYVVIVTRGHRHDAEALEACIHAPAAYFGLIGSRRKVALVRQHFLEAGLATVGEWERVYAPVGLEIGAVTVPEIATSIMAQLIAVRRKGGQ